MDWWENDPSESERVCPCREKSCCPATFDSFRHMPAHCRQQHPDKLPFGGTPPQSSSSRTTSGGC